MNSNQLKRLFILVIPGVIFVFIFFISLLSGSVSVDYVDISADSKGNVYIGELSKITVINSFGEHIRDLKVRTSNGYSFIIVDDIMYLNFGSDTGIKTKDLEGNSLEIEVNDSIVQYLQTFHPTFIAPDGTEYYYKNEIWGMNAYSLSNGEEKMIYHMPTASCIMRLSPIFIVIYFVFIVIALFLPNKHLSNKTNK